MSLLSQSALCRRISLVPATGDALALATGDLEALLAGADGGPLAALLSTCPAARDLVLSVASNTPYLRDLALRDAGRLARVLSDDPAARVAAVVAGLRAPAADEADLMRRLRRAKQEVALATALADLGGVLDTMAVTGALTAMADAAVSAAARFLLAEAHRKGQIALPDPEDPEAGSGYILLAMGKHGAGELNYSSDIDLIVLYDGDVVPAPPGADLSTFFVRLTRRLVRILQERTGDGYVFRTDLRLRPDPGATPVALSVLAALQYYESMGQNWERAAMIKARPCAGDIAAGERFLAELKPYVWRKYLDYAAIRDIHSIKRQIHAHKGHGRVAVAGHNVKLGRGGIREIEFFVQTQQLIAGGRNPPLRGRGTLAMLDALVDLGWLKAATRDELAEAYGFLRQVEHRIQMIADEQSHTLPETPEGLARIGRLMGFSGAEDFAAALECRLVRVSGHYAALFEEEEDLSGGPGNLVFTGDDDDPGTIAQLSALGFQRPQDVTRAVRAWHFGRYAATRSTRAREMLTEITPRLVAAFAATEAADQAFMAFDALIARLPAGVQLFALLSENPALLDLLATILGTAPRLADIIARRPHVMDAILEPAFFGQVPSREEVETRLAQSLAERRTFEEGLDLARIFGQEQMFLIGVRIVSGTLGARQAGIAYARLANVLLDGVLAMTAGELERVHGRVPGGRHALVAMGKLGGREMTAASDLDLMLLYEHDDEATQSDGPRPLAPSQYYARLTQRFVTALSAPTGEGTLYEVDFRLRPSGNAGPIATRLSSFVAYQREEAWTWEHMALTRARIVTATEGLSGPIARQIAGVIADTLCRRRDPARIRAEVADMRARIEAEKGSHDPFDVKVVPGGLIDVEFIAQTLQLLHAADHPSILSTNTEEVLLAARAAGVLPVQEAELLVPAIRLYHDVTQALRLAITGPFRPAEAPRGVAALIARAGAAPGLASLAAQLAETQAAVRAAFERIVGPVVRMAG